MGRFTTLRSWLSTWSQTYSNGDGLQNLPHVDVPIGIMSLTADQGTMMTHARQIRDAAPEALRDFFPVKGFTHYFRGQPEGFALAPSADPDSDIDYTFAQVSVGETVVDYGATCGNLASAVGPFAVDEGLLACNDGEATVRIRSTNTGKIIVARFEVRDGQALVAGEQAIAGVAGTGAPVSLDFLEPGGSKTGKLLPTGNPVNIVIMTDGTKLTVSIVDAANPCVFVKASAIGLSGYERPVEIDSNPRVLACLEHLRAQAGVAMKLAATADEVTRRSPATPKVAVVAEPGPALLLDGATCAAAEMDISVCMLSMGSAHKAVPLTGALCLAVAARISGTVVHETLAGETSSANHLRIGTPSGVLSVDAAVDTIGGGATASRAAVLRTARRLMEGCVLVPAGAGDGEHADKELISR